MLGRVGAGNRRGRRRPGAALAASPGQAIQAYHPARAPGQAIQAYHPARGPTHPSCPVRHAPSPPLLNAAVTESCVFTVLGFSSGTRVVASVLGLSLIQVRGRESET